ncbi:hypothetical protein [Sphingomonas oligophenolica]
MRSINLLIYNNKSAHTSPPKNVSNPHDILTPPTAIQPQPNPRYPGAMIYSPDFADQARAMCRLGATDEELAEHFGVCVRTIYRWRNTHEEFAEAVVAGKEHADARVERALYSRAVGCSVQRTKVFKHAGDPDPVYATCTEHLPPDPVAALNWLRVRQPKKWGGQAEDKDEPGIIEMFERALARVNDPESPFRAEPCQTQPEAAQPEPEPGAATKPEADPEPISEPPPAPDPASNPGRPPKSPPPPLPVPLPVPEEPPRAIFHIPVYAPITPGPPEWLVPPAARRPKIR